MNDDELKKLWQQQPLRNPTPSAAQLVSAMQNKTTQLRRTLLARDIVELAACALAIIIFGIFYFLDARWPVSRLGDLIVIGSSIFIAFKLVYARRTSPPAPPGATIVESLRAELNAVRAQSQLLGSIQWWYLLPLAIGIFVCTWGKSLGLDGLVFNIIYSIFVIALFAYIYRLNQRARSKQLLPLEAQLKSLLRSAETGEPLDETHVASLRPIVLSMAAADQVKPVEFKVAFWQLAIFGVSGIVGIWFFLMLSLTLDNKDWKTKEQSTKPSALIVHVEETNRYSVVARTVVDLLNKGDYDGVHKLFNADMSKFLPPEKSSNFFAGIVTLYGNIEKLEGPTTNGYRGWPAFRLDCQRSEVRMDLALDADNKIAGIFFPPTHRPSVNIKSFVVRLFSWQHLVWLLPFFLGGLLYSWLMQKLTKRAVGISSLGIHLHKGQHLIFWDDIKEARPGLPSGWTWLRILNIQNLWLIRESGEKTLMHWTPLERHADLKAAVENFAPANHPIRQYLPLLKRI